MTAVIVALAILGAGLALGGRELGIGAGPGIGFDTDGVPLALKGNPRRHKIATWMTRGGVAVSLGATLVSLYTR